MHSLEVTVQGEINKNKREYSRKRKEQVSEQEGEKKRT